MKIQIVTIQNGIPVRNFLPVITDAHNVRYSHAEDNSLYFRTFRFPYKEMTKAVAARETGTVKFQKSYIRAVVKRTETLLHFVFRYTVETVERKKAGEMSRRSVIEKERVFLIEASKAEIVRLVEPFLVELENVNPKKTAAMFIQSYNDWAHPITLESVTAGLTDEQKAKAAKLIKEYFAA